MSPLGSLNAVLSAGTRHEADDPAKVKDAARQFESLLIGQLMKSARESTGGWLGSGNDSSTDCALEYAEQHFAAMLAQQGGLGLSSLIANGLGREE